MDRRIVTLNSGLRLICSKSGYRGPTLEERSQAPVGSKSAGSHLAKAWNLGTRASAVFVTWCNQVRRELNLVSLWQAPDKLRLDRAYTPDRGPYVVSVKLGQCKVLSV